MSLVGAYRTERETVRAADGRVNNVNDENVVSIRWRLDEVKVHAKHIQDGRVIGILDGQIIGLAGQLAARCWPISTFKRPPRAPLKQGVRRIGPAAANLSG